jgi:hypothetical protein
MIVSRFEDPEVIASQIREGVVAVESAAWNDLVVGGVRYRILPSAPP